MALILELETQFVDRIYAYGIAAPDTFGLLIAHLNSALDVTELIGSSFMHRRNLEALPALIGAFAGAIYGGSWLPESYLGSSVSLVGVSIPSLSGTTLSDLVSLVN